MKIKVGRDELANGVNAAAAILQSKNAIPVLACFRVDVTPNSLAISAHDLQRSATVHVPAEADETGAFCTPGAMLQNLINKSAKGADVVITVADRAAVKIGRSRYQLP